MPTSTRSAVTTGLPDAWVLLFARVAIAPLFLYSGVGKVLAFAVTAGRLPGGADGLGAVLAAGAIAVELGGGMALLLGLFSRQAAAVLFPFTIAATLMFHNFWAVPEAQVVMQTINFLKNLGLLGALALIAFYGPGAYAVQTAIKAGPKGAPGLS
ncbi:putative oxidoreductase [Bradyrhizobium japonicum]|jgi:putative oxidoreductase|uniref:DoxX family protein n=1 Tax=Bradyrhizobium TaxID=374 RepID=UPI00040BF557|nr:MULTISPECIES: DoxX family protein [Bradyrhizobium]MBR0881061.1 DoxX family protein [Bradyrhizobium liaoningense]MBR0947902.1 DoxX family protein [Bradyrhizobium liaoningense]MBR1003684.1 DoxX family protein [Bradyrhizobium liaoningense]MBR1027890.1 DoxX family protein [Bradyrhizobium liaoningense]MBR1065383.1 DoxX family protein [Bradyrhizobium liaoningense]